ncbi:MAG: fibronectin type III-like domain-contianing protein, partial [bacterium]
TTVQFPFGYGLSYTAFEWSDFSAEWKGDECIVNVTVKNTGDVAGKDVVQIYAQTPYTEYDKANNVEKASVSLVGYAKTGLLQPNEAETVTVKFNREQLKSYDYTTAKTYIIEDGDYYVTAATDAHNAVNNILECKEVTAEQKERMCGEGNKALAKKIGASDLGISFDSNGVNAELYAQDTQTGIAITNQFDFASEEGTTYLTRQDWEGTFPETDGTVSTEISTNGNPVNSADGKNYVWKKQISDADYNKL